MIEGPENTTTTTPPTPPSLPYDPEELWLGLSSLTNSSFLLSPAFPTFLTSHLLPCLGHTLQQVDNKEMKLAALVILITVAWFVRSVSSS